MMQDTYTKNQKDNKHEPEAHLRLRHYTRELSIHLHWDAIFGAIFGLEHCCSTPESGTLSISDRFLEHPDCM